MKIIILFAAVILLSSSSFGQKSEGDEKEKKRFKSAIEKIVDDAFRQVEREVGVPIYEEDEENVPEKSDSIENDEPEQNTTDRSDKKQHKVRKLSLYAFPLDQGVPRNYSAQALLENLNDKFIFRYNRVEGLLLGFRSPRNFYWEKERSLSVSGSLGYGFGTHRWQFDVGLAQQFGFKNVLLELGIEGHDIVDTRDHWLIGNLENSLNALFARYDYRDYFLRQGFSSWMGMYTRSSFADMQLKLTYANDDYTSLQNNVGWSLFRPNQSFRENPAIDNSQIRSIIFTFDMHKLDESRTHLAGWSFSLSTEFAGKALKGNNDFNRYVLDVRRYQPLSKFDNINLRLRAASSDGYLPLQRAYELGGVSTLPAYAFKQFSGNRFLLANLEYIINGKMVTEDAGFPLSILKSINLILFYDAGYINAVADNISFDKGFNDLKINNLKTDLGFALSSRDGKYRLGFAWKTDVKSPVSIFFRMSRPF